MTAARLPIIAVLVGPVATAATATSFCAESIAGARIPALTLCCRRSRDVTRPRFAWFAGVARHLLDAPPAGVIAPRRPSLSNPHSPRGGPRFSSIRFQRDRILPCRSLRPRRAISQKPQDYHVLIRPGVARHSRNLDEPIRESREMGLLEDRLQNVNGVCRAYSGHSDHPHGLTGQIGSQLSFVAGG